MDFFVIGGIFIGLAVVLELLGVHTPLGVFIAALFAGTGGLLSKRQIWWGQLFFIIGNVLLMIHFINIGLYGNAIMFTFFIMMCLWTIYNWIRKGGDGKTLLSPTWLNNYWRTAVSVGFILVVIVASFYGTVRMLDFGMMYLGIVGKLMIARKKTDGLASHMLADTVAIGLFFITGQWFLLMRSAMAWSISFGALRTWEKQIKKQ